jgi:type II secretory pathway component GspD/PulD (secretin)
MRHSPGAPAIDGRLHNRLHGARVALLLTLGAAILPSAAQTQTPVTPASASQTAALRIDFVNADLSDVIRSVATALGVNIVVTDVPPRRITFRTPEPVPAAQAGSVLEGILASQGLVLVANGPVFQVLPTDKRPPTGPLHAGKTLPDPPPLGLITQIVPLDYMRADEAVSLLHDVADKEARVEVVPRSNAVLITDRGVNVARYLELLRQIDVKTGGEAGLSTYVYPLKHANATELATTLGQVFGATVIAPTSRAAYRRSRARDCQTRSRTSSRVSWSPCNSASMFPCRPQVQRRLQPTVRKHRVAECPADWSEGQRSSPTRRPTPWSFARRRRTSRSCKAQLSSSMSDPRRCCSRY